MGENFLRMISMVVTSIKATRFEHKKVIESWMEKGKEKQEKFNNTEPLEIYCEGCEILTEPMHKSLWEEKESLSVSFIYNCPKCNKRKAYYDNGEEYKGKPTL